MSTEPEHSRYIQERRMHVSSKTHVQECLQQLYLYLSTMLITSCQLDSGYRKYSGFLSKRNTYQTAKIHGTNSGVCHTDEVFRDLMVWEGRRSSIEDGASCSAFQPMWPGRAQDTGGVLCGWSLSKGLILEACCRFSRILVTAGLSGGELLMSEKKEALKRLSA